MNSVKNHWSIVSRGRGLLNGGRKNSSSNAGVSSRRTGNGSSSRASTGTNGSSVDPAGGGSVGGIGSGGAISPAAHAFIAGGVSHGVVPSGLNGSAWLSMVDVSAGTGAGGVGPGTGGGSDIGDPVTSGVGKRSQAAAMDVVVEGMATGREATGLGAGQGVIALEQPAADSNVGDLMGTALDGGTVEAAGGTDSAVNIHPEGARAEASTPASHVQQPHPHPQQQHYHYGHDQYHQEQQQQHNSYPPADSSTFPQQQQHDNVLHHQQQQQQYQGEVSRVDPTGNIGLYSTAAGTLVRPNCMMCRHKERRGSLSTCADIVFPSFVILMSAQGESCREPPQDWITEVKL